MTDLHLHMLLIAVKTTHQRSTEVIEQDALRNQSLPVIASPRSSFRFDEHIHRLWLSIPEVEPDSSILHLANLCRN